MRFLQRSLGLTQCLSAWLRPALRIFLTLSLVVGLSACAPSISQHEAYVFGTRVQLTLHGVDEAQAGPAVAEVLREFTRLHHSLHAWQPSELSALNHALAAGQSYTVTPELAGLLREAQQWSHLSNGLFDPALGGLVALWGFHSDTFESRLPDPTALAAWQAAAPSMADVHLAGTTVRSTSPAVQFDFGGFAKGYALDRAADILRQHGIHHALINIGGNVLALGTKGDRPWRVGVQHPRDNGPLAVLPLYDGEAIGTTGDYQRYFELDGQRYAHVLDPRTGYPARASQSLTVLVPPRADAGRVSDMASKPAFIAGDAWLAQLRALGLEHGLRVAADGRVEISRALRLRVQTLDEGPPMVVLD